MMKSEKERSITLEYPSVMKSNYVAKMRVNLQA